jgi:hypothetical protein
MRDEAFEGWLRQGLRRLSPARRPASFRAFFAFSGGRDRDRVITVTMFDSRRQPIRSHEQALSAMRGEGKVAPNPPQGRARRVFLLATA